FLQAIQLNGGVNNVMNLQPNWSNVKASVNASADFLAKLAAEHAERRNTETNLTQDDSGVGSVSQPADPMLATTTIIVERQVIETPSDVRLSITEEEEEVMPRALKAPTQRPVSASAWKRPTTGPQPDAKLSNVETNDITSNEKLNSHLRPK